MKSENKYSFIVILIIAFLLMAYYVVNQNIFSFNSSIKENLNDENDLKSDIKTHDSGSEPKGNNSIVFIPEKIQADSNLKLLTLSVSDYKEEVHAWTKVVDIQSLLELNSLYRETYTEMQFAEKSMQIALQEYEKLKLLRKDASNISERQLQQSKLAWLSNKSQVQSFSIRLENIKNSLIQKWGPVLAEQVVTGSDIAASLFQHKTILLLVTLENNQSIPDNVNHIQVGPYNNRGETLTAEYISAATFADKSIYGQSYFFHAKNSELPIGTLLDAWIIDNKKSLSGINIPDSAIVWYVNKPWVYIKSGSEEFARKEVKDYQITRNGWFVQNGFEPGEKIVINGGQMLFSEEFRWSIPDEDDDP